MALSIEPGAVTHGIQLAIAPVFLLTAVAGMIGAVATRLGRIIDRARVLEARAETDTNERFLRSARRELSELRLRAWMANSAIALLTCCGLLIGLTIVVLFLEETTDYQGSRAAVWFFMVGVLSFLAALLCFLGETVVATRRFNFNIDDKERQT